MRWVSNLRARSNTFKVQGVSRRELMRVVMNAPSSSSPAPSLTSRGTSPGTPPLAVSVPHRRRTSPAPRAASPRASLTRTDQSPPARVASSHEPLTLLLREELPQLVPHAPLRRPRARPPAPAPAPSPTRCDPPPRRSRTRRLESDARRYRPGRTRRNHPRPTCATSEAAPGTCTRPRGLRERHAVVARSAAGRPRTASCPTFCPTFCVQPAPPTYDAAASAGAETNARPVLCVNTTWHRTEPHWSSEEPGRGSTSRSSRRSRIDIAFNAAPPVTLNTSTSGVDASGRGSYVDDDGGGIRD